MPFDNSRGIGYFCPQRVTLSAKPSMYWKRFQTFLLEVVQKDRGRVRLTGRFTLHLIVKAFMTLWFGLVILATLAMALGVQRSTKSWAEVGYGVGMFLSGLGLVTAGKWLSRNDARWLSEAIHTALSSRKPASEA